MTRCISGELNSGAVLDSPEHRDRGWHTQSCMNSLAPVPCSRKEGVLPSVSQLQNSLFPSMSPFYCLGPGSGDSWGQSQQLLGMSSLLCAQACSGAEPSTENQTAHASFLRIREIFLSLFLQHPAFFLWKCCGTSALWIVTSGHELTPYIFSC